MAIGSDPTPRGWRRWIRVVEEEKPTDVVMKEFVWFTVKVTVVQAVTYILAGILAYPLLTRQFFEGASPLLAPLMRLPSEPELWSHVTRWMLPAQIVRGVLIAGALYPFLGTLQSWSFTKRCLSLASLYVVIGQWTSPVAGASTIEGWVILRPEFTTPQIVLSVIPEGLIQGLGFGAWLARWLAPKGSWKTRSGDVAAGGSQPTRSEGHAMPTAPGAAR